MRKSLLLATLLLLGAGCVPNAVAPQDSLTDIPMPESLVLLHGSSNVYRVEKMVLSSDLFSLPLADTMEVDLGQIPDASLVRLQNYPYENQIMESGQFFMSIDVMPAVLEDNLLAIYSTETPITLGGRSAIQADGFSGDGEGTALQRMITTATGEGSIVVITVYPFDADGLEQAQTLLTNFSWVTPRE